MTIKTNYMDNKFNSYRHMKAKNKSKILAY